MSITGTTQQAASLGLLQVHGCGVPPPGSRSAPGPTNCRPSPASHPAWTSTSTAWSWTPPRGVGPSPRAVGAGRAHGLRPGADGVGGPRFVDVRPGGRARSHRSVLDGARREHQCGLARRGGRQGSRDVTADRRLCQRLARDPVEPGPRHGDHVDVDSPAIRRRRHRGHRRHPGALSRPGVLAAPAASSSRSSGTTPARVRAGRPPGGARRGPEGGGVDRCLVGGHVDP